MSTFEDRIKNLNKQQKQAVDTIDGPVMVIAGPGSGKTELLSLRVANILKNTDASPGNILCLTFTDAAAFNMRNRLAGLIGHDAYRVSIHTFHSFGVEIINYYPEYFYNGATLLPADQITQTEILEKIFTELPYDNPLRSEFNGQFTYLYKTKKAIEYLKKAGLTPDEFKTILAENKKEIEHADPIIKSVFNDRISKKLYPAAISAAKEIGAFKSKKLPGFFRPFAQSLAYSLAQAVKNAEDLNATSPVTEWKNEWTEKGEDGFRHITDLLNIERMEALADIYEKYMKKLRENEYYDFDDMILDAISVLENNLNVKLDLQERYQYILVDEFQDTNDAQMRLLKLLTDNPVNEGRPNIMVVGDDDQAIFKFQGAEITNVSGFQNTYRKPELIVLKENYRSTQDILDAAKLIIKKGVNRLENIFPELKKELIASNKNIKDGKIHSKEFASKEIEYHWITTEIKKLIEQGISPKEIAVIAREHKDLESLAPYFHMAKIPIAYERQQNVLQEPHILELITMAKFVDSIMKKSDDADNFLPEILNYPFWNIKRSMIWELSIKAIKENKPWLMVMKELGGQLSDIAEFFINLGGLATYATAEEVLQELIGGPQQILSDEKTEEETAGSNDMFSPFRSYYFNKDKFTKHRADYLNFLSSLKSFIESLREYRRGKRVNIGEMIEFFDIHTKNNLPINNTSPFINSNEAVQLMSAHKAKGLEFEAVFVLNCQEDSWAGTGRGRNNITLPSNLPISPAGDNIDDQLRLFYVAITRAKRLLYLTSYKYDNKGKESSRLGFISPEGALKSFEPEFIEIKDINRVPEEMLVDQLNMLHTPPFVAEEKALLKPILDDYKLNVTHLQNFLNVVDGGPATFFEKNLLLFPEPKTPSGILGSAAHETIKRTYNYLKNNKKLPPTKEVLIWFEESLKNGRLNQKDFDLLLQRGQKAIENFYNQKKKSFSIDDKSEFDFKKEGAIIDGTPITGRIDKIKIEGNKMIVEDFKTGKPIDSWSPTDQYAKIKAWRNRNQLIFYKLLIENSKAFGNKYTVNKGVISFIEPLHKELVGLTLDIDPQEVERLKALIGIVYKKIINLDFPDISKYAEMGFNGIKSFEEDLLKNDT